MIDNTLVARARARIESVIAERNIKLSPGKIERCGPCPMCGGTFASIPDALNFSTPSLMLAPRQVTALRFFCRLTSAS
jgi:hypothetical protein